MIVAQADITPIRDALIRGGSAALVKLAEFHRSWETSSGAGVGVAKSKKPR